MINSLGINKPKQNTKVVVAGLSNTYTHYIRRCSCSPVNRTKTQLDMLSISWKHSY